MNAIATRNCGRRNLFKSSKFHQNENDFADTAVGENCSDFNSARSFYAELNADEDSFECSYGDFEKDLEQDRQGNLLSSISFALFDEARFSSDEVIAGLESEEVRIRLL